MNQRLFDYLKAHCRGRENAATGDELAKLFNCQKRDIQKCISKMRREQIPIISVDQGQAKGYFWPVSAADATECIQEIHKRATMTFKTAAYIRMGIEKEFGDGRQIELDLGA